MEEVLKWMLPLMPWIALVIGLEIHFKPPLLKSLSVIENSIALLSCYAVTLIIESKSVNSLKFSPGISFYFILSLVFFILFISCLLIFSKKVNDGTIRWPVPLQLILFVAFVTTFQTAYCFKQKFADSKMIRGYTLDSTTKRPIPNHKVELTFRTPTPPLTETSNSNGEFRFVFKNDLNENYPYELKAWDERFSHDEIILDTNNIDNNFEILLK